MYYLRVEGQGLVGGGNEDSSPGDSSSESFKRLLLQRGRREGQYICDYDDGGIHAIKHIYF